MNLYNQKHDVKIVCQELAKIKNPKVSEICEHKVDVVKISFFQRSERQKNKYTKIELKKDFIIDLYNQKGIRRRFTILKNDQNTIKSPIGDKNVEINKHGSKARKKENGGIGQ